MYSHRGHAVHQLFTLHPAGRVVAHSVQTFRTKIFLALSDDFSARTASDLCGKEEQLEAQLNLSENDQDARVSVLTGRGTAHKATISTSKSYNLQRDWMFESKVFSDLKNAQSIVLAYEA